MNSLDRFDQLRSDLQKSKERKCRRVVLGTGYLCFTATDEVKLTDNKEHGESKYFGPIDSKIFRGIKHEGKKVRLIIEII